MTSLVQTLILGLLVGALYALMASGLTLIFGVMRVINLAHGAFAVLAAFLTYTLWKQLGLDPLLSIPIVMAVMFGFGWLVYVLVIRHVRGAHVTMTVLATFGIALMLEGIMGFIWGNTSSTVVVSYTDASLSLGLDLHSAGHAHRRGDRGRGDGRALPAAQPHLGGPGDPCGIVQREWCAAGGGERRDHRRAHLRHRRGHPRRRRRDAVHDLPVPARHALPVDRPTAGDRRPRWPRQPAGRRPRARW